MTDNFIWKFFPVNNFLFGYDGYGGVSYENTHGRTKATGFDLIRIVFHLNEYE